MKYKVGDLVKVKLGKDKGKTGKIERVIAKESKVIVAGLNLYKKHLKKGAKGSGGIIDISKPLYLSKVQIICPKCNLPTKIGYEITNKIKSRVCRKCRAIID